MDIVVSSDIGAEEWDELVLEDESASFFQTRHWSELLTRTLPTFRNAHLVCRVDGRAVACLPALRRDRLLLSTLESGVYGTFGGPVARADAHGEAVSALLGKFAGAARAATVGIAQIVDRHGRLRAQDLEGFARSVFTVQVVPLDRSYEELFAAFKPSARNKIRKARRAGVRVRRASGEDDFLAYFELHEECSREWSVRPRPGREFFLGLSGLDPSMVQVWLAVHEGRVIAGDLNFSLHGAVMNWGNVSSGTARKLAPNNLLHAHAIEQAVRGGCHTYDLGGSAGLEGVRAFKASFGAVEREASRYVMEKPWYRALRRVAGG